MNKAVLISIRLKWCELIASGKKTIEVRKTRPKLEVPFKCYIYCTKNNTDCEPPKKFYRISTDGDVYALNGKVIGEFVCNKISWIGQSSLVVKEDAEKALYGTCLTRNEAFDYLGLPNKNEGEYKECYGWHISNLVIYDKPKELSEFRIERPPQSWRYVEECENNA